MTCYFCPVEAPCGDIEHRERFGVRYAEGQDVYQYVQHSGVLDLGQSAIQITFGLLVNYTTKIGFAPHSTLGLSFGRADIPKTFLQQLKDANVIDVLSYSVRYSQVSQYATGNLVVGGSAAEAQGTAHLPLKLIPGARRGIHVSIVSMTIAHAGASPAGGDSGRPTPISLDGSLALFDTGTCCIAVPYLVIAALVRYVRERIEADPRVETVLFRKDSLSSYMVRSHHVRFLPVIVYSLVGEGGKIVDVKIFPEHYVGWCNVIWCEVHIYAHSNGGEIVVGEPFFRAYDAHIDLENNTTAITAHPLRPSWEKALQVAKQPRRMKICDI
ncbi:hypothetical protein FOZ63_006215 [Perkinsus olseni]|uniref:Peptidase A1 domain-containing protein n=1 Tax=Perkinsus olseni TaxID=32597 RepID=A0A7J6SU44_PEROL|nr:hypothetical protein FOZ63_006215 [Perkinsus olseni]